MQSGMASINVGGLILAIILIAGVFFALFRPEKSEKAKTKQLEKQKKSLFSKQNEFLVVFIRFVSALKLICDSLECPCVFKIRPNANGANAFTLQIDEGIIHTYSADYTYFRDLLREDVALRTDRLMRRFRMPRETAEMIDLGGHVLFHEND